MLYGWQRLLSGTKKQTPVVWDMDLFGSRASGAT